MIPLLLLAACWTTEDRRVVDEERVRTEMDSHWDDAVAARDALVQGDLSAATRALDGLAKGMPAELQGQSTAVFVAAARRGADATDLTTAAMAVGEVAWRCGQCHAAVDAVVFAPGPTTPTEGDRVAEEMGRHRTAVEQLWLGLVRPDDEDLRAAVTTLAADPLTAEHDGLPARAAELETAVHDTAGRLATATGEDRGRLYGELITTCAVCHAIVRDGRATTE